MKYYIQNNTSSYKYVVDNIINNRKEEIFTFFDSETTDLNFNIYDSYL